MRKAIVSALLLMGAAPAVPQTLKLSPDQQHVWSQEEKYWEAVKARDANAYVSLWDENFVGWPSRSAEPIRKEQIRQDPFGMLQGRKRLSAQLEPKAVEMFNNVAIVHYRVTGVYEFKEGGTGKQVARITHTWRRRSGLWLIIGGMSVVEQAAQK